MSDTDDSDDEIYKIMDHNSDSDLDLSSSDSDSDTTNKTTNSSDDIKQCTHASSYCRIKGECCENLYMCCTCHDENEEHQIDRTKKNKVECKQCDTLQNVSNECICCGIQFADNFCKKCLIFNDNNIQHCEVCGICIDQQVFGIHKCFKQNDDDCAICLEKINDDPHNLKILLCGHILHHKCYKHLIVSTYKCPLCSKTIMDKTKDFMEMKNQIEKSPMIAEMQTKVNIHCNDCEKKSEILNHYVGLMCSHCESFNTYKS